jgi:hypothetical protein
MIKQRDLIIIILCLSVLAAVAWYWAYYQPSRNRILALEARIEERKDALRLAEEQARQRSVEFDELTLRNEEIQEEWKIVAADLPERFVDTDVFRHVQSVIYPHTRELSMNFSDSVQREGDELWSTKINLSFSTTYWQLLSLLDTLVNGDLGNRVVNYSLGVSPLTPEEFLAEVERSLGDIPDHIINEFSTQIHEYFTLQNENAEIWGLHMLNVGMEIEYLGLYQGLLSQGEMRTRWEEEDNAQDQ